MHIDSNSRKSIEDLLEEEFKKIELKTGGKVLTITELENIVTDVGNKFKEKLLGELSDKQAQLSPPSKKNCPECGKKRKFVNYRNRTLTTLHGPLTLRRAYLYCENCQKGECPQDRTLGLISFRVSPAVAEKACLAAARMPFVQAADHLWRMSGIRLSATCIEDISRKMGDLISEHDREKAISNLETPEPCDKNPERLYAQADGAMVNTIDGWHENKLGMVFSEQDIKRSGEGEKERISIQKKSFVTSFLEGPVVFKNLLKLALQRAGAASAKELILVTDGASWLMNLGKELMELYGNVVHILDWFHVTEHLWKCSKDLFGENSQIGKEWVARYKAIIWDGGIKQALEMLLREADGAKNQTPLRELYGYFNSRQDAMDYAFYRQQGYYIGSGAIESANKYAIQDRLKKSGMKWSARGANAIAHLTTKYLSGEWDNIWSKDSPILKAAA